jgi:outer membrane lipoprotein LolB
VTRRFFIGAALLVLAGCASVAPPAGEAPPLAGRLAVTVAAQPGSPNRSASTQFELHGNAERGRLVLTSPLGTTLARASWQPGAAEADTGRGHVERHANLDALAQSLLGEPLPLAALVEWLHGRPWSGAPHTAVQGGFEQLGWRIDTSRRADGVLLAARAAAPAITVRALLDAPQ